MSGVFSSTARAIRSVATRLTIGAIADGQILKRVGTAIVGAAAGGDASGPVSSTDNAISRFDGTGGKTFQNSLATIDDSGSVNIPTGQTYKINNVALVSSITNSAGANVVPKSDGTNLVASRVSDDGTNIAVNSGADGTTTIGDTGGAGNNTKITVSDSTQVVTVAGGTLIVPSILYPFAPETGSKVGDVTNPFESYFVGAVANNSSQITGTFTGNRVATLPDVTGTVQITPAVVAFASLPASPFVGQLAVINNSSTDVWGAVADGAGALTVLVWWNGIAWKVLGK